MSSLPPRPTAVAAAPTASRDTKDASVGRGGQAATAAPGSKDSSESKRGTSTAGATGGGNQSAGDAQRAVEVDVGDVGEVTPAGEAVGAAQLFHGDR